MRERELIYGQSKIGYAIYGSGPQLAVCIHGYGETARTFAFLGIHAVATHTFIAIDLPFHGTTAWKEDRDFRARDLEAIIKAIIEKEQLNPSNPITLIGFSLGGRILLSFFELSPQKTRQLLLIAPDGLKVNRWYWLATQTWLGNRLFAFTMKHPSWFFAVLKLFNKFGLVNSSIFKFVNHYIGDPNARHLLYTRWTVLKRFRPNLTKIKSAINKYQIPVTILYGSHDRIILPVVGERFKRGIETNCTIRVIASGHQVLHEKHAEAIVAELKR